MHRKHKSTKVPNVKLRPRPAASPSYLRDAIAGDGECSFNEIIEDRNRRKDAELDQRGGRGADAADAADDEAGGPLTGANFCFTGVTDEKTALAHAAYQLGASVEGNLTESTTHLIALNPRSFKYECALSLGLFVLLPQFLFECLNCWREAQDLSVDSLLRKHSLKPLHHLKIGICGIEDRREREQMKSRLKALGAVLIYPMLIKDDVTHLICGTADRKASNTLETVYNLRRGKVGQSDERRAADQLKCVRVEWVEDCASVGGRLSEEMYDIWTHRNAPSPAERAQIRTSIPSRAFSECKKRFNDSVLTRSRITAKLQREEEEQRRIKIEGQASTEALLRKSLIRIGASKGAAQADGSLTTSAGSNLLRMERRVEAPLSKRYVAPLANPQDDKQQSSGDGIPKKTNAAGIWPRAQDGVNKSCSGFSSLVIRLDLLSQDSSKEITIREALTDCGVQQHNILSASDRSRPAQYCLTSYSGSSSQEWSGYGTSVTTFWLEQCIHYERIIDPSASSSLPYLCPAGSDLPIAGAEHLVVSLTGFSIEDEEPERVQLTKCLKVMGCKVTGSFSRRNTHLLSARPDRVDVAGSKEGKAIEWGIPVVGIDFVERMWGRGQIDPTPAAAVHSLMTGKGIFAESPSMEETQKSQTLLPANLQRVPISLCQDITNHASRCCGEGKSAKQKQSEQINIPTPVIATEQHGDHIIGVDFAIKTDKRDSGVNVQQDRPQSQPPAKFLRFPVQQAPAAPSESSKPHPETIDTQASSLAGQSMWATRMEGEVNAFLATRKKATSSSTPTGSRQEAADVHMITLDAGAEEVALPPTPSAGAKRRGKLPPKSRRSASGAAASPGPGRRGESTSPVKAGSGREGEGEDSIAQDAAQLLLAQRTLAARQAASYTVSDTGTSCQSSHHPVQASAEEEGEKLDGSIKITYGDPQAERERRKLEELVEGRGPGGRALARAGASSKRNRGELSKEAGDLEDDKESSDMVLLGGPGDPIRNKEASPPKKKVIARKQAGMGR